ncbi:hypothetical protein L1987_89899 [Smallanthus sonchifolius]|nr:hypothetical protein L1987_89899 [Smallanthus sonchifolius]
MDGPSVTAIRDHINASWGLKTNLLKLHGVSALVTKRKRLWSLNTKKLPEPVTSKSGLVTTATIEQNDLYCTPHNAPD